MSEPLLLVIDDEVQIRRVIRNAFQSTAVRVLEAATGSQGIDLAAAERPDLIILDLGLPDMSGADVCREIRQWSATPILVLSARHSEQEKVQLLDAGADDYVTKPFSTVELQARARALLRRAGGTGPSGETRIEIGDLVLDLAARVLTRDGEVVRLTPIEWDLLRVMMVQAGRALTHQYLFTQVWTGRRFGDAQQYLRVHVAPAPALDADIALARRVILAHGGRLDYQDGRTRVALSSAGAISGQLTGSSELTGRP